MLCRACIRLSWTLSLLFFSSSLVSSVVTVEKFTTPLAPQPFLLCAERRCLLFRLVAIYNFQFSRWYCTVLSGRLRDCCNQRAESVPLAGALAGPILVGGRPGLGTGCVALSGGWWCWKWKILGWSHLQRPLWWGDLTCQSFVVFVEVTVTSQNGYVHTSTSVDVSKWWWNKLFYEESWKIVTTTKLVNIASN